MTQDSRDETPDRILSISETVPHSGSIDNFPSDVRDSVSNFGDKICKLVHFKGYLVWSLFFLFFHLPADVQ